MIAALVTLLAFQLAGEVLVRVVNLPIPGPVAGMLLLLLALIIRRGPPESLRKLSHDLLQHLSLLFVPAGVGVMAYTGLIQTAWLPLAGSLLGSALLTLAVTGLTLRALARRG